MIKSFVIGKKRDFLFTYGGEHWINKLRLRSSINVFDRNFVKKCDFLRLHILAMSNCHAVKTQASTLSHDRKAPRVCSLKQNHVSHFDVLYRVRAMFLSSCIIYIVA